MDKVQKIAAIEGKKRHLVSISNQNNGKDPLNELVDSDVREDYIANQSFSVSELLNKKSILLVGADTYVGKMFLRSVLTSISNISTIKVLIDACSFQEAKDIFRNDILADSLFDGIRENLLGLSECAFSKKFECIPAQTERNNLGLSAIGLGVLAESIDQIVNCGSGVNLPQSFKQVLGKNTIANLNLIKLAKLNNIPVLHLSTVYVQQVKKGEISESLASAPKARYPKLSDGRPDIVALIAKYQSKIDAIEGMKLGRKCIERKLLKLGVAEAKKLGFNDPYLLTRWMSEHLYAQELKDINLTIVRTSVIRSPLVELNLASATKSTENSKSQGVTTKPDELRNIDRLMLAHATGELKRLPVRKRSKIDFAPVDRIANILILAMAEQQAASKKPVDIYHCATGGEYVSKLIRTINQSFRDNNNDLLPLKAKPKSSELKSSHPWVYRILSRLNPRKNIQPEVERLAFYMNLNCSVSVEESKQLVNRFEGLDQQKFPTVSKINWLEKISKDHQFKLKQWMNRDQVRGDSKQDNSNSSSVEAVA